MFNFLWSLSILGKVSLRFRIEELIFHECKLFSRSHLHHTLHWWLTVVCVILEIFLFLTPIIRRSVFFWWWIFHRWTFNNNELLCTVINIILAVSWTPVNLKSSLNFFYSSFHLLNFLNGLLRTLFAYFTFQIVNGWLGS